MTRVRAMVTVCCIAALAQAACGSAPTRPPEPDPVAAVVAYRDALAEGRPGDAFALIHPDARDGLDLEGFLVLYSAQRDVLVEQAERLVALATSQPAVERAQVSTRVGPVDLVRTPDGWRIERPVGSAPAAPESM